VHKHTPDRGDVVRMTPGTEFLLREDDEPWTRHTADDEIADCELVVALVTGPHATMNGGGFDYSLTCPHSGAQVSVRTTLARPAAATFVHA
jgi:hypothetical protein